jgi:hypothetical protein
VTAAETSREFDVTLEGEARLERLAFEAATGTTFAVHAGEGAPVMLTLAEVEALPAPEWWEYFALLFDGPGPALPQWTYRVEHATMGTFPLFLGPVAAGPAGLRYEAVFNRQAPDGAAD